MTRARGLVLPRLVSIPAGAVLALVLLVFSGCSGVDGVLSRAETAYKEARYEDASLWLSEIAPEIPGRGTETRVRFHYLRGMASYRLEHRVVARYHLGLASELAGEDSRAILGPSWARMLDRTLEALAHADSSRTTE